MSDGVDGQSCALFDVSYGPDPSQCLDVFLPDQPARAPVVMFVHGGGWSVGDKSQYEAVGDRLAREGLLAIVVNYRLSPDVKHPTHAEDVARAVAWGVRYAADQEADLDRFCLMGHSAGAHLAALVALDPAYLAAEGLVPASIQRVIGIAGVGYDLDAGYADTPAAPFLEPVFGLDHARWQEAAPLSYVGASAPDFLLIHGLADFEAPPASTENLAAALGEVGVTARLVLIPDEGHVSVMFAAVPMVLDFLQQE